jgi:hypothetical protein
MGWSALKEDFDSDFRIRKADIERMELSRDGDEAVASGVRVGLTAANNSYTPSYHIAKGQYRNKPPRSKQQKVGPKKYYAVAVGRTTGIFTTWDEADSSVSKYSGGIFKRFKHRSEAKAWLGGKRRHQRRRRRRVVIPVTTVRTVIAVEGAGAGEAAETAGVRLTTAPALEFRNSLGSSGTGNFASLRLSL